MQGHRRQSCNKIRGLLQVRLSLPIPLSFYKAYDRSCFSSLIQTRFKKSLEPWINPVPDGPRRKALRAVGTLVLGFSGGTCSTALLDLVAKAYFAPRPTGEENLKGGKDHPRNVDRRVWKGKPAVCYVEVCSAFPAVCDLLLTDHKLKFNKCRRKIGQTIFGLLLKHILARLLNLSHCGWKTPLILRGGKWWGEVL